MSSLYEIISHFLPDRKVRAVFPFGSGHIHDTYKVETVNGNFVLQKINTGIFKDVPGMMANIEKISAYLTEKQLLAPMQVLQLIKPGKENLFFLDDFLGSWRMFGFVEGSKSFDRIISNKVASEGGRAFGWFLKVLQDFPVNELVETIPGFHNANSRLNQFEHAIASGNPSRVNESQPEIDFCLERSAQMLKLQKLTDKNEVPLRVTHNDTKINNVLFDEKDQAICVIDLDTVMPGTVFADYGDAIRTFTNTGEEDDRDVSKVAMNFSLFEAFTKSYLKETKAFLNQVEIENLARAPLYIIWEQSIRFLGDYLLDDAYYKTEYPEHNLVRTWAQLALLKNMERSFDEMQEIILSA